MVLYTPFKRNALTKALSHRRDAPSGRPSVTVLTMNNTTLQVHKQHLDNTRLHCELRLRLRYPHVAEGLRC